MEDRILEICRNRNGFVTSKDLSERGIPSMYLTRMTRKGSLAKLGRGIYFLDAEFVEDPFLIFQLQCPHMIYTGVTAMYLQELTNRQFQGFYSVIDYNSNVPKMDGIHIFRTRKVNWDLGAEIVETPYGNKVRCYDKERIICNLFLSDDYDDEDRVYALNEYAGGYLNISKLYKYAKILGVYEKVSNVFEVIRWNYVRQKVW